VAKTAPASGPAPVLGRHDLAITDLDIFKVTSPPGGYPANMRTFYSPEDHVPQVLQSVISSVSKSIVVAMFGFDDEVLAAMLDTALKNPAIFVQITLDKSQAGGVHEKALLAKYSNWMSGNSVAIGHVGEERNHAPKDGDRGRPVASIRLHELVDVWRNPAGQ
jgi:hypothetical protein